MHPLNTSPLTPYIQNIARLAACSLVDVLPRGVAAHEGHRPHVLLKATLEGQEALRAALSQRKFTVSWPPCTTLSTPGGRPQSLAISASIMADSGTRSEGFMRNALPAVVAGGNIHSGIIAGKLKGAMPAHTPRGTPQGQQEKMKRPGRYNCARLRC